MFSSARARSATPRLAQRALQMACRLLAYNAEHWLANRLNTYLGDPDEYRAITRHLRHTGGVVHKVRDSIHIELDPPDSPRISRALKCSSTNSPPPRRTSPATAARSAIRSAIDHSAQSQFRRSEYVSENDHFRLLDQGFGPGGGAIRLSMRPTIAHLTIASWVSGSRS